MRFLRYTTHKSQKIGHLMLHQRSHKNKPYSRSGIMKCLAASFFLEYHSAFVPISGHNSFPKKFAQISQFMFNRCVFLLYSSKGRRNSLCLCVAFPSTYRNIQKMELFLQYSANRQSLVQRSPNSVHETCSAACPSITAAASLPCSLTISADLFSPKC